MKNYYPGLGEWKIRMGDYWLREDIVKLFSMPDDLAAMWRRIDDSAEAQVWIGRFMESYEIPNRIRAVFGAGTLQPELVWPTGQEGYEFIALTPMTISYDGDTWFEIPADMRLDEFLAASAVADRYELQRDPWQAGEPPYFGPQ